MLTLMQLVKSVKLAILVGMVVLCAASSVQAQLSQVSRGAQLPQLLRAAAVVQTCRQSTGATDDDLQALMSRQLPTTRSGQCLIACVGNDYGVLRNGQLDEARATQLADDIIQLLQQGRRLDPGLVAQVQAEVHGAIRACGGSAAYYANEDACAAAAQLAQCGYDQARQIRARIRQSRPQ